jgi:hypothetical protein
MDTKSIYINKLPAILKTDTLMKLIPLLLICFLCSCSPKKQETKFVSENKEQTFDFSNTYEQLEKKIQVVIDSSQIYEFNPNSTFDIIAHTENTTKDIVNFINKYSKNPDSIKGLKKNAEFENLKIYSYGFWSGGTRGFVTYSILTIETENSFIAANISENIQAGFDSIIKLDKEFYLLLGGDKAYSNAISSIAYLVKITDKIDLEYPAFVNRPFLNFYNGEYEYDFKTKLLKFKGEDYERLDEVFGFKDKYTKFSDDSLSSKKLSEMIKGERYYDTKSFVLKFNGKHFERFDKQDNE